MALGRRAAARQLRQLRSLLAAVSLVASYPTAGLGQVEGARPSGRLASWLTDRGIDLDVSVEAERAALRADAEVSVVAIGPPYPSAYRIILIPGAASRSVWQIDSLPGYDRVGIELAEPAELIIRFSDNYGFEIYRQYHLDVDAQRITDQRQFTDPTPEAMLISGGTLFASYDFGRLGRAFFLKPLDTDTVLAPLLWKTNEPLIDVLEVDGVVYFVTQESEWYRTVNETWGGRRRKLPVHTPPPGVRFLYRRLPQFRVVPGGIEELRIHDTLFIPLDLPDLDDFKRARPEHFKLTGEMEMNTEIGPVVAYDSRIWFGLTFYDGEGLDGVGGIGWFDPESRAAEMIYPPELADWSVSAITGHEGAILVAREGRPEGAPYGGGLGRYDIVTEEFRTIDVPGVIGAIAVDGETLYALSSKGLFVLDGGRRLRFRLLPGRGSSVRVLTSQE